MTDSFDKQVDAAYEKKVVQKFVEFHKAVTLDAYQKVSTDSRDAGFEYGSPVWSGAFRASHNLSVGAPDFTPGPVPEAGERWPDEPDAIIQATALSKVAQILLALKPFGQTFIANAKPYSRKLENGYSLKAPEGIYKVAAMSVIAKYRSAARALIRG